MEPQSHKTQPRLHRVDGHRLRDKVRTGMGLDGGLAIVAHMRGRTRLGTHQHHTQCHHHLFKAKRLPHKEAAFKCWVD